MTLRIVTYDDSTHKIVPIEPTNEMINKPDVQVGLSDWAGHQYSATNSECENIYKAMIEAAPEYQEPETEHATR